MIAHGDVEKSRHHDVQALPARHVQIMAGKQRRREQDCGANGGAGKPQAPGRYFLQRHRRADPVEAPGKGQQHDQELGGAGHVCLGVRVRHCAVGPRSQSVILKRERSKPR
jgi:hypothetical protein